MIDQPTTTNGASSQRLIDQVSNIRRTLDRQHIPMADMSRSGSLETRHSSLTDDAQRRTTFPVSIERLEGRIRALKIDGPTTNHSRFRYFLDGSQKTIPVCRVGLTPLIVGLAAAGMLYREIGQQPSLLGQTTLVKQSWILPTRTRDPHINELIRELDSYGISVVDPIVNARGEFLADYDHLAGDYGRIISLAYERAGNIRAELEREVLQQWSDVVAPGDPDHWIVVDGRLLNNTPRAVGIVKDLQTQLLGGGEAVSLFDLPQGYRTTAFRYGSTSSESGDGAEPKTSQARTMWYMRLWSASGMDARHSLIRVETAHDVASSEEIDEISRWILSERLPRPTDDPRWPTLLYPIHYLERILKRRLSEITTGWPST